MKDVSRTIEFLCFLLEPIEFKLQLFGVLKQSDVVISAKSIQNEMMLSLGAIKPNDYSFSYLHYAILQNASSLL